MIDREDPDEILLDLDKVILFIHNLKPGELIVMKEFVRICAIKPRTKKKKKGEKPDE